MFCLGRLHRSHCYEQCIFRSVVHFSLTFQTHYQSENCHKYITMCKTIGSQSVVKNLKLQLDHIFLYVRSLLDL